MFDQTEFYTPKHSELSNILDYITRMLASSGLDSRACGKIRFRTEDLLVMLMNHARNLSQGAQEKEERDWLDEDLPWSCEAGYSDGRCPAFKSFK